MTTKEVLTKNILVVDDEMDIREISRKILQRAGYNVFLAENGEVALNLIKENSNINLILLDVEMPEMTGYTFLLEMQKLEGDRSKIPVIMVTAYGGMEPIFLKHGVSGFIVKPGNPQELMEKVNEIINAK